MQTKITDFLPGAEQGIPSLSASHGQLIAREDRPSAYLEGSEKVVRGSERSSLPKNVEPSLGNTPNKPKASVKTIMSGHHIRFYARYKGVQPIDSEARIVSVKNWNKHIWDRQTYTIIAGTKTLEICLEYDTGLDRVSEKRDELQKLADRIGSVFARRHGLELLTSFELSPHSHWVVMHKKSSDLLKPLCKKPGNDRTGAVYGDSSHPDSVEFIGSESIKSAEGMDGLLLDLPVMIQSWNQGAIAYRQDVKVLMGAIAESIKLQNEILKHLIKKG